MASRERLEVRKVQEDLRVIAGLTVLALTDKKAAARQFAERYADNPKIEPFIHKLIESTAKPFEFDPEGLKIESKPRGQWMFYVVADHRRWTKATVPVFSAPGLFALGEGLRDLFAEPA